MPNSSPKVFISYSWSSSEHQEFVRTCADRLLSDGIEVIFDVYDLNEGDDKFAFMESMVTDDTVSHVLVFCDKVYSEKANAREAGVGTESQIISENVYNKVKQSKFIPIACELDEQGSPYLPTFFKSRIFIDFSSIESVNDNWERLIRLIFGKPQHEKPQLGKPPIYIVDNTPLPTDIAASEYPSLRRAVLRELPETPLHRSSFLDACFAFADSIRVREAPDGATFGEKIVSDCGKLKRVRNHLVDWVLLEASVTHRESFDALLIGVLERLRELKSRPSDVSRWNETWFEAHAVFVYETFLYIVAALLKAQAFGALNHIFSTHYMIPEVDRRGDSYFEKFDCFHGYSRILQDHLTSDGRRYHSPEAELIKRQADRTDVPFETIIEAEALALLMVFLVPDTYWYPGTLHYAPFSKIFPFFLRSTRHAEFKKLAIISGIDNAPQLLEAAIEGHKRLAANQWSNFRFGNNFLHMLNLNNLDTLK